MKFPNPTEFRPSVKDSSLFTPKHNRKHIRARFWPRGAYLMAAVVLSALVAGVVASAASPSILHRLLSGSVSESSSGSSYNSTGKTAKTESVVAKGLTIPLPAPAFFMPQTGETIDTYAANCSTPKSDFSTGNTVCAKATGFSVFPRKIYWINPDGLVAFTDNVSAASPSASRTITMRGVWRAYLVDASDGSLRLSTPFNVSDANNPAVDLAVINNAASSVAAAEGDIIYRVIVRNAGPDTAHNVQLTESAPNSTTYVSSTSPAGITCTQDANGSTCTISTLAPSDSLSFTFTYQVNSGTPIGTSIVNTAEVASDNTTDELHQPDNVWKETVSVVSQASAGGGNEGGGETCTVACPDDIVKQANTVQGGQPGAVVHFSAPSGNEECGTVTTDMPNDSFYAVGTYTVTATASTGETCTFTIEVTPPASGDAPTISCPANIVANADSTCQATVSVGTPSTTGADVTVSAERSDEKQLTEPFPTGVTTITWKATNSAGSATCTQTVTVNDTTPPTIIAPAPSSASADANCEAVIPDLTASATTSDNCATADPVSVVQEPASGTVVGLGTYTITLTATDGAGNSTAATTTFTVNDDTAPTIAAPTGVTVYTGSSATSCSVVVSDATLGTATASDNCSGIGAITRSGVPSGNAFPVGTTTVTYSVTDGAGHTSSAGQTVTVVDNTAPTITAPANVTVGTGPGATSCSTIISDAQLGNATANDNCSVTVTRSGIPAGNDFPKGTTTVTYTATDGAGNTATATQTVTVNDTTPPVITVSGANPMTVECHTSFTDPGATANDNCSGSVAVTSSGTVNVDTPGTYTLTYTAKDADNNTATATRTVNVVDTTPPVITTNGQTLSMWPPNHKYQTFLVTNFVTGVSDSCNTTLGLSSVVIEKVTSDEIENGNGDGNTLNDILVAANCKSVQLRSEREGNGNGRIYTITFKVTDASGNVGRATAKVIVPVNAGATVVDSGVHYTVNGSCP
jgi:uncharacterized repeat protein (TIGR01451 family)